MVELAKDMAHGDYASNVALILGKQLGRPPLEIAQEIVKNLQADAEGYIEMSKTSAVAPGFVNFWLSEKFYADTLKETFEKKDKFGWGGELRGKKIMVEYTDPNAFKPFHVGHLMSNAIGESVSRLFEASGATVRRMNYLSDVGLNLAMAVWGMKQMQETLPDEGASLNDKTQFLGKAYVFGVAEHGKSDDVKQEVEKINKQIYTKEPGEILDLYQLGRTWSLDHFDDLYKRLGSHFDYIVPESEVAEAGLEVIREHRALFTDSEGAVVFVGEPFGLHTRVFINSHGLPTYEAKELGLTKKKLELFAPDTSVVLTGNEQNDYFKVVMKAIDLCFPEFEGKTKHIGHGMLRFASGKMSSRKGNVITGEELIAEAIEKSRGNEVVGMGAIKYSILKQAPGRDIIFDIEKSLSLEGDSGPYIQYAYTRAKNVLAKVGEAIHDSRFTIHDLNESEGKLMRMIGRLPEIISEAQKNLAPQLVCTYLIELAGEFHHFYATNRIADPSSELGAGAVGETRERRLALTAALAQTIQNGLWILGILTVEKM